MSQKEAAPEAGVTLIELTIAMTMMTLVMLVLGDFVVNGLANSSRNFTTTILQANTKQAVETIAQKIRAAKRVEAVNGNADSNSPGAPANLYSWTATAGSNATLVLGVPARDSSNNLLYIDGQHTSIYLDDLVFYLEPTSKILYKRVIKNTSAPGNVAVTTCPPAAASPSCPADAKVVEDVANLTTVYYDANNNVIVNPTGVEAIQITLQQTKQVGNHSYTSSFSSIIALRNK